MITIEELFDGSWGIAESRRKEIEVGPFGIFDRLFEEEVTSNFLPIEKAAALLECHERTARNWLRQCNVRYIKRALAHLYYKIDVERAKAMRAEKKADWEALRSPTKQRTVA